MSIAKTDAPPETASVARMATIPHGNALLAEGTAISVNPVPGGTFQIEPATTAPFAQGGPLPPGGKQLRRFTKPLAASKQPYNHSKREGSSHRHLRHQSSRFTKPPTWTSAISAGRYHLKVTLATVSRRNTAETAAMVTFINSEILAKQATGNR